ncbi:MAG: hypothetical protein VKO44_11010 [Cyanobacteriota bacterium]|jgi:hypothetical protein|nr:hypothetical protein [Cyanobacteriota bacterium]
MSAAAPDGVASLAALERLARERGWLLRLAVPRRLGLWGVRAVVARPIAAGRAEQLGELKGWATPQSAGLRLDTLRVWGAEATGAAPLLLAASCAWALEATPCRRARFLAIHDNERQHRRLVRYFRGLGFTPLRELGAAPSDWGPRLLWGGSGLLMEGECAETIRRCARRLQ